MHHLLFNKQKNGNIISWGNALEFKEGLFCKGSKNQKQGNGFCLITHFWQDYVYCWLKLMLLTKLFSVHNTLTIRYGLGHQSGKHCSAFLKHFLNVIKSLKVSRKMFQYQNVYITWTVELISAAKPPVTGASWLISKRPVFATDWKKKTLF